MRFEPNPPIVSRDLTIGVIGTGFIVADVQLAAYRAAGFNVRCIAGRTPHNIHAVADRWEIEQRYDSPEQLIDDSDVDIVDIAYPPHLQPDLVRRVVGVGVARGVLVQKPAAISAADAEQLLRDVDHPGGPVISVNQNMRYDQSIRALHRLLRSGELGEPIVASIDMRAVPHWQSFLRDYDRLTLANMSVHHLDTFRFLFGDPQSIYVTARTDPRTTFEHLDGVTMSHLVWDSGLVASSIEDTWAGPDETPATQRGITWRVEGTLGVATGTIGWPDFPDGSPSTIAYTGASTAGEILRPSWDTMWFPDAFAYPMHQLQHHLETGAELELSLEDSIRTIRLVEAGYRSIAEGRKVVLEPQPPPKTGAHP